MGLFTNSGRRSDSGARGGGGPRRVPTGFEAVAEALQGYGDVQPACAELGRRLARDGVDLRTAIYGLRTTYDAETRPLDPAAIETLAVTWGEETLSFVHQVSCEDPLTGLATLAHLRARLSEIYRRAEGDGRPVTGDYALLVIDLPRRGLDVFGAALLATRVAELVRMVFTGDEPMCQVSGRRLVAVCRRGDKFGTQLAALKDLLDEVGTLGAPHMWVERLPGDDGAAAAVLDEVAR